MLKLPNHTTPTQDFQPQGARPCDSAGALVKPGEARAVDDVTGEMFDSNKIKQCGKGRVLLMILLSPSLQGLHRQFWINSLDWWADLNDLNIGNP